MNQTSLCHMAIQYAEVERLQQNKLYFLLFCQNSEAILDCIKDDGLVLEELTDLPQREMEAYVHKLLICNKITHKSIRYASALGSSPNDKLAYPFSFSDTHNIANSCVECCFCFILE